jgi:hypothetical protein
MKFYKNNQYIDKILDDNLSAVYNYYGYNNIFYYFTAFYNDGKCHNSKNAAYIDDIGLKHFF